MIEAVGSNVKGLATVIGLGTRLPMVLMPATG